MQLKSALLQYFGVGMIELPKKVHFDVTICFVKKCFSSGAFYVWFFNSKNVFDNNKYEYVFIDRIIAFLLLCTTRVNIIISTVLIIH